MVKYNEMAMQTLAGLPTNMPVARVEFDYDYMSRRVGKTVYEWGSNDWQEVSAITFLYDAWNLISEQTHKQTSAETNFFTFGLDLSGTLQGAGGVGGLLSAMLGTNAVCYTYDGNGNVSDLINCAGGAICSHYEYSPFGETIVATGELAKSNPFRFSAKYTDDETSLVYYGYRYYLPGLGRWVNRDPIGENGGLNLFAFCANGPINGYDAVGLDYLDCLGACIEQNDPMNALIDSFIGRMSAKLALGSAGVPKSILLWIAKLKGDAQLVKEVELSIKMGKDLAYKPTKIILDWLGVNRGIAAKAARSQAYVLAVYGTALAVIEVDCATHCICKDKYEGGNIFNTKEAIDFYIEELF